MRALRGVGESMFIMVCDGFDPEEAEKLMPGLDNVFRSKSDSLSSIDRDDYEDELIRRVGNLFRQRN